MVTSMKDRREKNSGASSDSPGNRSTAGAQALTSYGVGALPILDRVITQMKLADFLREFMVEAKRCTVSPVSGTLVLLKNYLMSREPIYGIGEWARQFLVRSSWGCLALRCRLLTTTVWGVALTGSSRLIVPRCFWP
jgi:hypothetical protein